ncbi:type II toxin-antitoxin system RelE/ParE family toxin [Actinoplanes awajinensis]|uniref:Addiction module toxin RelE n=1 Tax=Actinoplanes awajinensis subsp. mycoplanecinus TaxID=135947 RepID=A0A101JH28_9ACTN|nr:type II toxin-antitoxin system RelE/ParE family toxin [Actinoplanes awajinensis]KUL26708.1 addiction module toxin RelE [Actinoplanes awajinensis subsp. mycoplanecinus]
MAYRLELVAEVRDWLHQLRRTDRASAILVGQAIAALLDEGPSLGRPLVDRVKRSDLHNLKELRPGSTGTTEIRILFIFDLTRNAVLLVAGDKAGQWTAWYRQSIPLAEARYSTYLKEKGES